MDIEINYFCTCKHRAAVHEKLFNGFQTNELGQSVAMQYAYGICNYVDRDTKTMCYCDRFKLDNLKYLEIKSDEA